MARCPNCKRSFRTLEDEENMHACPSCGYDPFEHDKSMCEKCEQVPCDCSTRCNVCGLDISSQATLISLEGYCGLSCYWQEFEQEQMFDWPCGRTMIVTHAPEHP